MIAERGPVELIEKKTLLKTHPFSVEELRLSHEGKEFSHPYHRLVCNDWANILPITMDNKAVMIRQPRAGSLKMTLEVPGGMIDDNELKDPMMAALRELEEETGFTSQRVLPLGSFNPNPALMNNRTHFFLALGCVPNANRKHFPDAEERIEVELLDMAELDMLVRTSQIDHALSALCIMLASKYVRITPA